MSAYRHSTIWSPPHSERVEQIMDAVEALLDNGFIIAKRLPDNPLNPVEVHVHRALIYRSRLRSRASRTVRRGGARCALAGNGESA